VSYRASDIVLEDGPYFVIRVAKGFEVYESGATAATRFGNIGRYPLPHALEVARRMIEQRKARQS